VTDRLAFAGKRRAIFLASAAGYRGPYTPGQVESTIARLRSFPPKHRSYALAVFCDDSSLRQLFGKAGSPPRDFQMMRVEVGYGEAADVGWSGEHFGCPSSGESGFGDSCHSGGDTSGQ